MDTTASSFTLRKNAKRAAEAGNPARPRRYRCAHRSIAHPCWNFSGKTWLHLDVKDLTAGTSLAAVDANALAVKRVPRVCDDDKLRSVC